MPRIVTLLFLLLLPTFALAADPSSKPNILLILTDDQGFGDLSLHGNPYVETPFLDAMMGESVELTHFHAAPLCAPTRASLMTGRHHLKAGVWGVHGGRDYMDLGQVTIAERLSEAGYRTAMAGKWHLGKTAPYLAYNRGFDESWVITDRLYEHTDPVLDHNGVEEHRVGWTVDSLHEIALEWISAENNRPFFFYLAHPYIHEPYYAPEDLVEKYRKKGLSESFATLCAMTEHLDKSLRQFFENLKKASLLENTIVLFMGDNGPIGNPVNLPHLTDEEMNFRNPANLRGVKGNPYENGTRAPCFIYWNNHFSPMVSKQEVDITDMVPTILELAGVGFDSKEFDGVSIVNHLENGEAIETPSRFYANHQVEWKGKERLYDFLEDKSQLEFGTQNLAIRSGNWKYVRSYGNEELFDLKADPSERHNLLDAHPDKASSMRAELQTWWEEVRELEESYEMPVFVLPEIIGAETILDTCAPQVLQGDVHQGSHFSFDWERNEDGIVFGVRVPSDGKYLVRAVVEAKGNDLVLEVGTKDSRTFAELSNGKFEVELGELFLQEGDQNLGLHLVKAKSNPGIIKVVEKVVCTRVQ